MHSIMHTTRVRKTRAYPGVSPLFFPSSVSFLVWRSPVFRIWFSTHLLFIVVWTHVFSNAYLLLNTCLTKFWKFTQLESYCLLTKTGPCFELCILAEFFSPFTFITVLTVSLYLWHYFELIYSFLCFFVYSLSILNLFLLIFFSVSLILIFHFLVFNDCIRNASILRKTQEPVKFNLHSLSKHYESLE